MCDIVGLDGRFNSRAREGRDPHGVTAEQLGALFQFTRPRGARLSAGVRSAGCGSRFNSRAREGRDDPLTLAALLENVSIHAPARGATRQTNPRGGCRGFNSRAREGRDKRAPESGRINGVSIHAPARGATPHDLIGGLHSFVSIHAPARGATRHGAGPVRRIRVSIHAPARGATNLCRETRPRDPSFNSRAREGRDRAVGQSAQWWCVSIHAPARGATPSHL